MSELLKFPKVGYTYKSILHHWRVTKVEEPENKIYFSAYDMNNEKVQEAILPLKTYTFLINTGLLVRFVKESEHQAYIEELESVS
ncbi:MAG: hypothetical protein MUC49_15690 [Raineya sp.]|jgi:hypothetical protein|nr:hypothetical protein [Raineya sp.]